MHVNHTSHQFRNKYIGTKGHTGYTNIPEGYNRGSIQSKISTVNSVLTTQATITRPKTDMPLPIMENHQLEKTRVL